jgi:RND superfamily putative drug exporter
MFQVGLIIGCGLLLDTFLVRTLTVPAIATLLGQASWWPQRPSRRRAPATAPAHREPVGTT